MKNTLFALTAGIAGVLAAFTFEIAIPTQEFEATLRCGNTAALEAPCEQTAEINPTF